MAPDFVLPDLFDDSLEYGLASYAGRPVILNFWASWCVPCRTEMPALQRAYEEHRDEGLVVLGVNQTFVDNVDAARDFVDELALTFPNVRDDDGNTSEKLYQVMGLPTSVLITAEGEIAHTQIGQMTDEQIQTFIREKGITSLDDPRSNQLAYATSELVGRIADSNSSLIYAQSAYRVRGDLILDDRPRKDENERECPLQPAYPQT